MEIVEYVDADGDPVTLWLNEDGQKIYEDCAEILTNVCDTKAEVKSYLTELVTMLGDDKSEKEIYAWLKETTEGIYNGVL